MKDQVTEDTPQNKQENVVDDDQKFSLTECKLLNLIAEIIVNISIRESYEKGD